MLAERARAAGLAIAGDEDGLGLGCQLAGSRPELLAHRQARGADAFEPASRDDLAVLLPELAAEVDGHPNEHEVPGVAGLSERAGEPLVARLLEVGEVDGVVDVADGVVVTPADCDPFLVHLASVRSSAPERREARERVARAWATDRPRSHLLIVYYSRPVRVQVDPFLPLDEVRAGLAGTGAEVEPVRRPLGGDRIVGLVVWDDRVGEEELVRLPDLRVVVTPSVGYDHIDVDAARRRGVVACHVPDYCMEEMAHSTLALLLVLLRGVVALDRNVRTGGWDYRAAGPLRAVAGTRLAIVDLGWIGHGVARRALALGMDLWASDPFVSEETIRAAGARPAALGELLAESDAVTLHLPLGPATEGLIGRAEIARMPRGAYLVNTARARLLDTEALLDARAGGHLAGAALDVLEVEPPTPERPAPRAPTLIVTPHAAFYSERAEAELGRRAIGAVRDVLEGRRPESAL